MYGMPVHRYDFMLNGVQKTLTNMSDEGAINAIRSMVGSLSEVKSFTHAYPLNPNNAAEGGVKEEWIELN